jgi:hypothetical protein
VRDEDGEPIGGVLVFTTDGYLSLLEVYSHYEPINLFPSTDRLELLRWGPS